MADIELKVNDFLVLRPGKFLSGDIIHAAAYKMQQKSSLYSTVLPFLNIRLQFKTAAKVCEEYGLQYKKQLSDSELIIVPISYMKHWTLVVVYPRTGAMCCYNSYVNEFVPTIVHNNLKEFFEKILNKQICKIIMENLPRQENGVDCGLYVLKFMGHVLFGLSLNNVNDNIMNSYRMEVCDLIREKETPDDSTSEQDDDGDGMIASTTATDDEEKLVCKMKNLVINGAFSYKESLKQLKVTSEPFIGLDSIGEEKTWNAHHTYKRMLCLNAIIAGFPGTHKEGLQLLLEQLKKNPEVAEEWAAKSKGPEEQLNPFHFRFGSTGNFQQIKMCLKKEHGIILCDKFKEQKKLKRLNRLKKMLPK